MKLDEFTYKVPENLIAQKPLKARTEARLMVVDRATNTITHDTFKNVGNYLPKKSMLVLNDSKVVPARLLGKKERTGGNVEIFLLKQLEDSSHFETLMRPLKKIKNEDKVTFNGSRIYAKVLDRDNRIVQFNTQNINRYLNRIGHMPLPPYIKRKANGLDQSYYQTVYAKNTGSVAAPTAGLHFNRALINQLKREGKKVEKVTLHINYATFKPVEEKNIKNHKMHSEDYSVLQSTYTKLKQAKSRAEKIVAVGTTATRVLETIAKTKKFSGSTNLFIYPGYQFKMVDCLITNFHLPMSTLLMLVYAFGSKELMKKAYKEAIKSKYRLFSYGDAMLIL